MIIITGAHGFVGQKLMNTLDGALAAPSLRGASPEDIRRIIEESGADTVIHTAAVSDIGTCQANPEESYLANVTIPLRLAQSCTGKSLSASAPIRFTAAVRRLDRTLRKWQHRKTCMLGRSWKWSRVYWMRCLMPLSSVRNGCMTFPRPNQTTRSFCSRQIICPFPPGSIAASHGWRKSRRI